jgi:hypothetical protein
MVVPWQADLSAHDYEDYMKEAQRFVSSDSTTRVAINDGLSFHCEHMDIRQPAAYVTDLEERLELARTVQNKIRASGTTPEALGGLKIDQDPKDFQLELMHLAVFLYADIAVLRYEAKQASGLELAAAVSTTESFLGICKFQAWPCSHIPPHAFPCACCSIDHLSTRLLAARPCLSFNECTNISLPPKLVLQRTSLRIQKSAGERSSTRRASSDDPEGAYHPRAKSDGAVDRDPNARQRVRELFNPRSPPPIGRITDFE